jgi:hypothetical protein
MPEGQERGYRERQRDRVTQIGDPQYELSDEINWTGFGFRFLYARSRIGSGSGSATSGGTRNARLFTGRLRAPSRGP